MSVQDEQHMNLTALAARFPTGAISPSLCIHKVQYNRGTESREVDIYTEWVPIYTRDESLKVSGCRTRCNN